MRQLTRQLQIQGLRIGACKRLCHAGLWSAWSNMAAPRHSVWLLATDNMQLGSAHHTDNKNASEPWESSTGMRLHPRWWRGGMV
eukprot:1160512-Pelagomonas_calceolata.AAC.1